MGVQSRTGISSTAKTKVHGLYTTEIVAARLETFTSVKDLKSSPSTRNEQRLPNAQSTTCSSMRQATLMAGQGSWSQLHLSLTALKPFCVTIIQRVLPCQVAVCRRGQTGHGRVVHKVCNAVVYGCCVCHTARNAEQRNFIGFWNSVGQSGQATHFGEVAHAARALVLGQRGQSFNKVTWHQPPSARA